MSTSRVRFTTIKPGADTPIMLAPSAPAPEVTAAMLAGGRRGGLPDGAELRRAAFPRHDPAHLLVARRTNVPNPNPAPGRPVAMVRSRLMWGRLGQGHPSMISGTTEPGSRVHLPYTPRCARRDWEADADRLEALVGKRSPRCCGWPV
jgi:hypothetical protein